MRRGFTLLELLVVMLIMALMGTAAVGGYRAMQRGMEERGVMQNANSVIRATYQRAQIDRQPTAIFFWNETLRSQTADENEVVAGRAVAVRRHGRLSNVVGKLLVDEVADLNLTYPTSDTGDEGDDEEDTGSANDVMYLYPMDNINSIASGSNLKRSLVRTRIAKADEDLLFYSGLSNKNAEDGAKTAAWAFQLEEPGGVTWKAGMAYGFEFVTLELPAGYIFGSDYSRTTDNPIRPAGTCVFKAGVNSGSGLNTGGSVGNDKVTIYSLRPNGASLEAKKVGTTDSPEQDL